MFRKMRRTKKGISVDEAKILLKTERRGVLSVNGDDGYPYAVPINYLYCEEENKIYFHGARVGHKADSIKRCEKVCFTVFGNVSIKDEAWAPYLQSVVAFGRCHLISNQSINTELVKRLAEKYYPNKELIEKEADTSGKAVQMFEIEIEYLSGKEIQER